MIAGRTERKVMINNMVVLVFCFFASSVSFFVGKEHFEQSTCTCVPKKDLDALTASHLSRVFGSFAGLNGYA